LVSEALGRYWAESGRSLVVFPELCRISVVVEVVYPEKNYGKWKVTTARSYVDVFALLKL